MFLSFFTFFVFPSTKCHQVVCPPYLYPVLVWSMIYHFHILPNLILKFASGQPEKNTSCKVIVGVIRICINKSQEVFISLHPNTDHLLTWQILSKVLRICEQSQASKAWWTGVSNQYPETRVPAWPTTCHFPHIGYFVMFKPQKRLWCCILTIKTCILSQFTIMPPHHFPINKHKSRNSEAINKQSLRRCKVFVSIYKDHSSLVSHTSHWLAKYAPQTHCTDLLPGNQFFKRDGNKT